MSKFYLFFVCRLLRSVLFPFILQCISFYSLHCWFTFNSSHFSMSFAARDALVFFSWCLLSWRSTMQNFSLCLIEKSDFLQCHSLSVCMLIYIYICAYVCWIWISVSDASPCCRSSFCYFQFLFQGSCIRRFKNCHF